MVSPAWLDRSKTLGKRLSIEITADQDDHALLPALWGQRRTIFWSGFGLAPHCRAAAMDADSGFLGRDAQCCLEPQNA